MYHFLLRLCHFSLLFRLHIQLVTMAKLIVAGDYCLVKVLNISKDALSGPSFIK